MAFRYMEDFDREKMLKYAKGELALQNKPVTKKNIEEKLDDLYYEWLASKVNDVVHKDDGIDDTFGLLRTLKEVPIKYCIIVEQWTENKPIHYEGKYFNFEDIYNNIKKRTNEFGLIYTFNKLIECIFCFNNYEKSMKKDSNSQKNIKMYKEFLKGDMGRIFFLEG